MFSRWAKNQNPDQTGRGHGEHSLVQKEAGNFRVAGQPLNGTHLPPALKGMEVEVQLPHPLPVLLQSGHALRFLSLLLRAGLLLVQNKQPWHSYKVSIHQ